MHLKRHFSANIAQTTVFFRIFACENQKSIINYAPFWIGFSRNGQSYRLGYSHPIIQNLTQNAVHKYVISTPYFLGYEKFKSGLYSYFGRNNPLSIW